MAEKRACNSATVGCQEMTTNGLAGSGGNGGQVATLQYSPPLPAVWAAGQKEEREERACKPESAWRMIPEYTTAPNFHAESRRDRLLASASRPRRTTQSPQPVLLGLPEMTPFPTLVYEIPVPNAMWSTTGTPKRKVGILLPLPRS